MDHTMYGYAGKRAIVTGAAYGIGKAIARRLADEGCHVALWDIDADALAAAHAELPDPARQTSQTVDVADRAAVAAAMAATMRHWGASPDILINNAGIGRSASILDVTAEEFHQTMQVNVYGTFNCSHAVAPLMRDNKRGDIINIASWFGKTGRPQSLAYCASKFAIIGMTQSMAIDLAPHGIRVNAVCPGTIDNTRMREQADADAAAKGLIPARDRAHLIPRGRLGQPEDITKTVAFLLSDEAYYMTGQAINVTGGLWMH